MREELDKLLAGRKIRREQLEFLERPPTVVVPPPSPEELLAAAEAAKKPN